MVVGEIGYVGIGESMFNADCVHESKLLILYIRPMRRQQLTIEKAGY